MACQTSSMLTDVIDCRLTVAIVQGTVGGAIDPRHRGHVFGCAQQAQDVRVGVVHVHVHGS